MSQSAPSLDEQALRRVVEDVLAKLGQTPSAPAASTPSPAAEPKDCGCHKRSSGGGRHFGVFTEVSAAAEAATGAYRQLTAKGVSARARVIEIVKTLCVANAESWGKIELDETKIGRLDHKIEKLQIIKHVPGVEWLRPDALSGDHGITLEEFAPFGVIGAILPVTHSVPTLSGNIVNMVAAGNAIIFNPHPGGARCAALAVKTYNEAIYRELGIENLICTIEQPSLDTFNALCAAPEVNLLVVTGGPGVVNAAMKSGKRAICAGPGNPPVVVDESADLAKAARNIITGAAYDNNLLCIGEKAVFVVDKVYTAFLRELDQAGASKLDARQLERLTKAVFDFKGEGGGCSHAVLKRDLVGKDPAVLAREAGATLAHAKSPLLYAETAADHLFVIEEQMMPMLPVVRVRDFQEGVQAALVAEHGYCHSAIIHTRNVDQMTYMGREMGTTLYVKNGPCTAGLGLGGEGYLSYSIATTTGEGITNPRTFTRTRRCVMVDNLRIF